MKNDGKTLSCICKKQGCWRGDTHAIPGYCQANKYLEEIDKAKDEYRKTKNIQIYEAACIVGAENNGFRPRVEEALHFAKQLSLSKIGFAACTAFRTEWVTIQPGFCMAGMHAAICFIKINIALPASPKIFILTSDRR